MAEVKQPFIAPEKVAEAATIQGILTGAFNEKGAREVGKLDGVMFKDKDGTFKASKNIKPALTDKMISDIQITGKDGEKQYFKRIAKVDDAGGNGAKMLAWQQVDEKGEAVKKDGKAQVVMAFPGYDGNPLEIFQTPQTKSMYAIGNGKLYPPTQNVPEFVRDVKAKMGDAPASYEIVAHSMGSAPATTANLVANLEGMEVRSNLQLEPVAATLGTQRLKDAFVKDEGVSKKIAATYKITPEAAAKQLDAIAANTTSVQTITYGKGKPEVSHSALLETLKEGDGKTSEEMRTKNIATIMSGREGGIDPENKPNGTTYFIDVTGQKNLSESMAGRVDPTHPAVNVAQAAQLGSVMATSIEKLTEQRKAPQAPAPAAEVPEAAPAPKAKPKQVEEEAPAKPAPTAAKGPLGINADDIQSGIEAVMLALGIDKDMLKMIAGMLGGVQLTESSKEGTQLASMSGAGKANAPAVAVAVAPGKDSAPVR